MNNQKYYDHPGDSSAQQLQTYAYTRGIGAYKPHFAGVPANYYPLTCKEIVFAVIILVLVIGSVLGIMIGFIHWVVAGGLEGYVITWVAVLIAFIVAMIILFYVGGKQRRRMEKKQMEMMQGKR